MANEYVASFLKFLREEAEHSQDLDYSYSKEISLLFSHVQQVFQVPPTLIDQVPHPLVKPLSALLHIHEIIEFIFEYLYFTDYLPVLRTCKLFYEMVKQQPRFLRWKVYKTGLFKITKRVGTHSHFNDSEGLESIRGMAFVNLSPSPANHYSVRPSPPTLGDTLYCCDTDGGHIRELDWKLQTWRDTRPIRSTTRPYNIIYDSELDICVLSDLDAGSIFIMDRPLNNCLKQYKFNENSTNDQQGTPLGMCFASISSSQTKLLLVSEMDNNCIHLFKISRPSKNIVDLEKVGAIASQDVGFASPDGLLYHPKWQELFIMDRNTRYIYVVSLVTKKLVRKFFIRNINTDNYTKYMTMDDFNHIVISDSSSGIHFVDRHGFLLGNIKTISNMRSYLMGDISSFERTRAVEFHSLYKQLPNKKDDPIKRAHEFQIIAGYSYPLLLEVGLFTLEPEILDK